MSELLSTYLMHKSSIAILSSASPPHSLPQMMTGDADLLPPNPVCADSRLSLPNLAAGGYTIALTLPNNFSFAENYGSGTLADGFIGLQGDYYDAASNKVRTPNYASDVTYNASSVAATPEPSTLLLFATGLMVVLAFRRNSVLSIKHLHTGSRE